MRDCCVHKNHSLALLIAFLAFFVTFGVDTMWLMQDKIPVMGQSMRPNLCAKQQLQQNSTNRHVVHDTASHGYALHSISSTTTATTAVFTLVISNLHTNTNEPCGRVVHSTDDDTSKANQDNSRLDSTNGPQVATSSGTGGGDDEEDPFKKKPNNDGCGGDESPSGQNDNEEDGDNDHDNEPENGFINEAVDVLESDNPDDFLHVTFDDDMDIDEDDMVEVGIVEETEEEDLVGLWEEQSVTMKQATMTGNA